MTIVKMARTCRVCWFSRAPNTGRPTPPGMLLCDLKMKLVNPDDEACGRFKAETAVRKRFR